MKIARFSRIGFILAAAGSAVGLGNIWKFPYITGEYGGGAFVLIYLITLAFIGLSVLIAEMTIGSLGRKDSVTSFEELAPKNKSIWKYGGFMAFTGLLIMTFYSVVIGWVLHYIVEILSNPLPTDIKVAEVQFTTLLTSSFSTQLFYHTIAFLVVAYVVNRGIKGGIEKLNLLLMPSLFLIIFGMFFYSMSLDGFTKSFDFMFNADWSKVTSEALVVSVGHAFFTISLGMGAILTYSASIDKNANIIKSSIIVAFLDTLIALLAGLMLFAFLFEFGAEPSKGPGLVFISLPTIFAEMGSLGTFFAFIFFLALAFAGLTSAVSLTEPTVQYIIDRFNTTRRKATAISTLLYYSLGILAILSYHVDYSEALTFSLGSYTKNLFDWLDFITAAFLLPIGGIVMAIFVGYILPKDQVYSHLKEFISPFMFNVWRNSLRYIAPPALVIVLLHEFGVL